MTNESLLKLHADLAWIITLLWIAKVGGPGEPNSDVHLYLGDRYWRLADQYTRRGFTRKAKRVCEKAERHLQAGGWRPLPPAAAMRMPVPKRPRFTQAIGWYVATTPPDDAA